MENINFINGKTIDGRPIILDGFRVESFMIYGNKAGDTIVVREYPEWPAMRPFVEKEVLQEVGGTTLLRCTHKKDAEGNHLMSVRAGSPG